MAGLIGACSSKSGPAPGSTTVSAANSTSLSSKVLASVDGFVVATDPHMPSGPETIDQLANGDATLREQLTTNGFVTAYSRTLAQGSTQRVAIAVAEFRTAAGAGRYEATALQRGTAGDPTAPKFAVAGVPGAIGIDIGTRETPGHYVRLVSFAKGTLVAEVVAAGPDASTPALALVISVAAKQARLM